MRLTALALTASAAIACTHAKPEMKAEAPAPAAAPTATASAAATPGASCTSDEGCAANQLCIASTCTDIVAGMDACREASAHFDYDRADLRQAELPMLRREARCLEAIPVERAVVAGNCDERGTAQYNVALGYRRAHSVQKYLEDMGVPAARLDAVSYGKERPTCTEETESCWAKNRRADVAAATASQ